jgi:ribonuclease-3
MSKGEKNGVERAKQHLIANAFEALVGAIYLDQGYDAAAEVIDQHLLRRIDEILESGSWRDSKSFLQQLSQRYDSVVPDYRVVEEIGADHDKSFTVAAMVNGREIGRGTGTSKQKAQVLAAEKGVEWYNKSQKKSKTLEKA